MTPEKLHHYAMKILTGFYRDHGTIPVIFIGVDPDESLHLLVATAWADRKEFCSLFISAYFFCHDIKMYAYTAEAWITTHHGKGVEDVDDLPRPSEDSNRKEVLICGVVNKDRHFQTVNFIVRDKAGRGSVGSEYLPGQMDSNKHGQRSAGIITDLLVDPAAVPPGGKEFMRQIIDMREKDPTMTPSIPVIRVIKAQQYTAPSFNL